MNVYAIFCCGQNDAMHTCDGIDEISFETLLEQGREIALRRVDDGELTADCVELYALSWAHGYDSVYQRYRAQYLADIAREIELGNL